MKRNELLAEVDIERKLFGTFFAFNNRLQAAGDAFYDEITCKQFFALICISLFKEEPPTINQLAEVMGSSHQNVKQLVIKLERNGFVTTQQDKVDKRKLRVRMTVKMLSFSKKYESKEKEFMSRFYEGVTSAEIAFVYRVITQIEENLIKIRGEFE